LFHEDFAILLNRSSAAVDSVSKKCYTGGFSLVVRLVEIVVVSLILKSWRSLWVRKKQARVVVRLVAKSDVCGQKFATARSSGYWG